MSFFKKKMSIGKISVLFLPGFEKLAMTNHFAKNMSRVQPISLWFDFWVWLIIYMEPKKRITCYVFKWLGDLIWKCNYISVYASNVGSNFVGRLLWHPHLPPSAASVSSSPSAGWPVTKICELFGASSFQVRRINRRIKPPMKIPFLGPWMFPVKAFVMWLLLWKEMCILNISKLIRGFAAWIIVWLSCRKGCLAFKIPL